MTRQTAFPGILVESISVTNTASGGGRTLEFEEGLPEKVTVERIQSFFDSFDLLGSDMVEYRIEYNLLVAAYTGVSAKAKSRTFVRFKNPFETPFISTTNHGKQKELGVLRGGRNVYRVSATIRK